MTIVIDADLVAALVLPLPHSEQASRTFATWMQAGRATHAPLLLEYEVASILRKATVAGLMSEANATEALREILAMEIQCHPPTAALHHSALRWAGRLGQSKAYDGHYLALAEALQAELWTADKRLVHGARQAGAVWVHALGKED